MAKLKFKKKCMMCKKVWVEVKPREYTICEKCKKKRVRDDGS